MTLIETRNDVLLLVGREDFSPPRSFGGAAAVATHDCVAFAVGEGPVTVEVTPFAAPNLQRLGEFVIEAEDCCPSATSGTRSTTPPASHPA